MLDVHALDSLTSSLFSLSLSLIPALLATMPALALAIYLRKAMNRST